MNNILLLACFFNFLNLFSQSIKTEQYKFLIEKYIENDESNADYTDLFDQIDYYFNHPININNSTIDELVKIPLMNPQKANAIVKHIQIYGAMKSLLELQVIEELEQEYIELLKNMVTVKNFSISIKDKSFWKSSQHEFILQSNRKLEKPEGYSLPDSNKNKFLGNPFQYSMRYRTNVNQYLSFGISTEKDDGELIKNGFVSAFVQLKKIGRIKSLILGDFQAAFGQGLTFGSGLAFGKSPNILGTIRFQNGIRASRSFNENEFLRGFGTQLGLTKNLDLTLFYSSKKIDGTLSQDTTIQDGFSSLINTGNYRNNNEIEKKDQIKRTIMGINLDYQFKNLKIGFTSVQTILDKSPVIKTKDIYKNFHNQSRFPENHGFNYKYYFKNMVFYGEFSSNSNINSLSHTNGVLISLDKNLEINASHRNFNKRYNSTFTNAFGENSENRNEKAYYIGASLVPLNHFKINAYADFYQFEWLKYLVDAPSMGKDLMVEIQFQKRKQYSWYFRYRQETKSRNGTIEAASVPLIDHKREIYRFHIDTKISETFSLRNRIELTQYNIQNGKKSTGFLMFQDVNVQLNNKFKLVARYQYFDTDDFNSRVYAFENDVLYTFSVPAFQNRGTRFYLMSKFKLNKFSFLWLRYSTTSYENVESIGNSSDKINSSKIRTISIQLSCQL